MIGKKFWEFKAESENNSGDLMLYGDISSTSWWGDEVTPKAFKDDLDALGDIANLNVYINSDGGDVFAGQAIYSMIKRHRANVTVFVDGLAASIASIIAMAGDKVVMPSNAMLMIHNPWTIAAGNANDFRKLAEDMDKIRESMLNVYSEKTGLSDEELIPMLDNETWMTAQDALELGFCNEIEEQKQVAASLIDGNLVLNGVNMNLNRYKNAPKLAFIPLNKKDLPPSKPPDSSLKHQNKTLSEPQENNSDNTGKERTLALLALELEL